MTVRVLPSQPVPAAARWSARLAFVAVAATVALVLLVGGWQSLGVVTVGGIGLAVTLAGLWWFLTHRGLVRWLALVVMVGAPALVVVSYVRAGLLWVVLVAAALGAVAGAAGRAALRGGPDAAPMPEYETPPPRRPFLIMNPWSGGGKVEKFDLRRRAEALGAEVALLDRHGTDVVALARRAVAEGADLLGVAGGDGTQALVAGVAAEHGVPLLVISAGTRNHFALDLGLDREDPSHCLDALSDGVELWVDLGVIGDRGFVNNASFGAYAEVVQSPAYRDDKRHTTLDMLPGLLVGHQGPRLVAHAGPISIDGPQALLVSNNPYEAGDLAGLGRRGRLDGGVLGVLGVAVENTAQAVGLLRGRRSAGVTRITAEEVLVDADTASISVGIDGEAVSLPTPVRCAIRPQALRVRVPRQRPGVRVEPELDWARLRRLALTRAAAAAPAVGAARRHRVPP